MSANVDPFVPTDRLLLVSIAKTIGKQSVYDAARYAWRLNRRRAESVDYVLAGDKGIVKGVFTVSTWLDASPGQASRQNFPELASTHSGPRLGFVGEPADETAQIAYFEKRVPDYLAIGQNGIRYFEPVENA